MPDDAPNAVDALVAGHICLDLIPTFPENAAGDVSRLIQPGRLTKIGPAVVSTGGAVSNTGLALHRLGTPTALMGKVGDDLLGQSIVSFLHAIDPNLAGGMIVTPGEQSSYTVVVSPPGADRSFLHCPGANDTFTADDVDESKLTGRLLHFGYPPIMRAMYQNDGTALRDLFARARRRGLTVSVDMTLPDVNSEAGQLDWPTWLSNVLPDVDLFLPSIEEVLLMLDRDRYLRLADEAGGAIDIARQIDAPLLREIADQLLDMGCAIVVLKLGDQGLYLRTTADRDRLHQAGAALEPFGPEFTAWLDREMIAPCFAVDVVGTTGSGDCTIAGFLHALLAAGVPEQAMTAATAVGASACEVADATSGIRPWPEIADRIQAGWPRAELKLQAADIPRAKPAA